MFGCEYDTITIDGFEQTFDHDYATEDYYFNGGETFTADEYAMTESFVHYMEQYYPYFAL